ncbi:Structural maintenance of chromosomes protein 2 [Desmophyllum pertusum]|uniref:Structural maintenance of chromosomes protein n=1 Tax=Desmophyllum pertusum TaxID=174260 RepID=A0A9X0D5J7_9CNID|nr:Structural maintenance of chromosomes protein 2 [Desmophyllum pertusum]
MYIKQVVIDGFKSYATRTTVSGFDPQFNAITGLNGSGKSNILDSICFLLGISNLSQVRASSLQELVYKGGQAGITKATVTITFDNTDKKQSPLGYETFDEITVSRQVVIGGRNKYLINGCNANNTRVQDLFRSVQLNVNNPHFLIMQGRITKVLNMKPPEILSMIEEAAGTRMYESKKQSAQRTIEKKDSKLQEIETILAEEITPTLTKLKEERASYLEYQKVMREVEHMSRLCIAHQFVMAEDVQKKSGIELENIKLENVKLRERYQEIEEKVKEIGAVISELEKKRSDESASAMKELEKNFDEVSKVDVKANSDLKHVKDSLAAEKKKKKTLLKSMDDDQSQLKNKEKELKKLIDLFTKLEEKSQADSEAVTTAQDHFHAVSAGLSSNEGGEDKTLADQVMTCKNEISSAETESKQAQMRLKHAQSELKKKQSELKNTEKSYKKDKDVFDAIEKSKSKLEDEMTKLKYEEGKEEKLTAKRRELEAEVSTLRTKVETLEAKFPNLQFDYRDPEAGFNRNKVKGLVAQLIQVKNVSTATGLEVTAGGKLYNVVVDTEVTGKKLISNGKLKRRYTFIPLNKIASRTLSNDVVKKAESLVGKDNVHLALSLVGYDEEIKAAMAYVFGTTFVCDSMDNAKKVTYDPKVQARTVTLGGDLFDPQGTATGGARSSHASILVKLQELNEAQATLKEKSTELQDVIKELDACKKVANKFREIKQQYDLKVHEAELVQARLKQSTHHHQLEEVEALQKTVEEQQELISKAKETIAAETEKCKDVENKMKEAKSHREKELKTAEEEVKKSKKKAEESTKTMKAKQQEVEEMKLEMEELKNEVSNVDQQVQAMDDAISKAEEQVEKFTEMAKETKKAVQEAADELNKQKEALKACNEAINEKVGEQRDLQKQGQDIQLELKEMDHKVNKVQRDSRDAATKVEHMLEKYDWISNEKHFFGQPNTAYDFAANDMKEVNRRLRKLEETKEKLGKNVNMRAMNMLGKAEEKYNDLMKKKRIVLNDKDKIASVIKELDEKKNEALRNAWKKVNKDFGSIFSTLLPGPQPNWLLLKDKQNSTGWKSLVALSLILSMLLFKPAPLYILDEVDAALDLSHTQNIGQMLRTHFRHSQFIVVSLKDGMFNNANVLFKTKFVDGVSTVTRYAQSQPSRDGDGGGPLGRGGKSTVKKNPPSKRLRAEAPTQPLTPSQG